MWHRYSSVNSWCATPIAYGSVSSTGTLTSGTDNVTVTRAGVGQYDIVITGETYSNNTFTVTASPINGAPRLATITDSGAGFRVNLWNLSSAAVDCQFHFTVHKEIPSTPG